MPLKSPRRTREGSGLSNVVSSYPYPGGMYFEQIVMTVSKETRRAVDFIESKIDIGMGFFNKREVE